LVVGYAAIAVPSLGHGGIDSGIRDATGACAAKEVADDGVMASLLVELLSSLPTHEEEQATSNSSHSEHANDYSNRNADSIALAT
jgi:hypothetical protein